MNSLRTALRRAAKRPGFSVIVILMLALGIGATTAMFSLFHAVLLRPLSVPEPERLVNVTSPGPRPAGFSTGIAGRVDTVFSYPTFRDLEERQDVFTGLAAHRTFDVNFSTGSRSVSAQGLLVSGEYFSVLGLQPTLGRLVDRRDEPSVGESSVAVLSYAFWRNQLGADPGIVGETISVNGDSLTVIGIAPEGFSGTTIGVQPVVYVPLTLAWRMVPGLGNDENFRGYDWLHVFARLRDGVSRAEAQARISALHSAILNDTEVDQFLDSVDVPANVREEFRNRRVLLEPGALGQSARRAGMRKPLTVLLGLTSLVLLIVCVNITGLLLARAAGREGEIAIRMSIGATRWHLFRQFLTESAVLASVGGLLSLPVATLTLRGIAALLPPNRSGFVVAGLDSTIVVVAAAVTLLTTILFGVAPALRQGMANAGTALKTIASQVSGGKRMQGFWKALATMQVALAIVLLVLAGLFIRSLGNIWRLDLGMDIDSVASFSISPGLNGYDADELPVFYRELEDALAAEPGVLGVGSAMVPLLSGSNFTRPVSVEGIEAGSNFNVVSPGFLPAISTPLVAGRIFGTDDGRGSAQVAIVNRSFARRFGLERPVGTRFAILRGSGPSPADVEIVGVVADAKYSEVRDETPPQFYLPLREGGAPGSLTFYVRASIQPESVMRTISGVVASLDPAIPVENLRTLRAIYRDNIFLDRTFAILSTAFAALATALAAVGLYGLVAESMMKRTREFGLRLALGSTPRRLLGLVLRQVAAIGLTGGALGIAASIGLGRISESLLFGVAGSDIVVSVAATAILGIVILAASYLPARRTTRLDPMTALRDD